MPERLAIAPAREPAVARRRLRGLLALIGAFALGLFGALGTPTAAAAFDEGTIHSLVNQSRAVSGLGPLTLNSSLSQVAASWANQMAANGTMSHNPSYSSQIPGGWTKAAENVAQGYPSGSAVHQGWMNSAGHRANIVGDFTDIGIAHISAGGTTWSVQVFAKYGSSVPPPGPAAAPPPPPASSNEPAPQPAAAATPPPPAPPEASGPAHAPVPQRSAIASAEISAFLSTADGVAPHADKRAENRAARTQGDSEAGASESIATESIATKLALGSGLIGAVVIALSGWFRFSRVR